MLNRKEIERNIDWLLNNGSAPVKYFAYIYLLKAAPYSKEMRELWKATIQDETKRRWSHATSDEIQTLSLDRGRLVHLLHDSNRIKLHKPEAPVFCAHPFEIHANSLKHAYSQRDDKTRFLVAVQRG